VSPAYILDFLSALKSVVCWNPIHEKTVVYFEPEVFW
jgi:hypothetical protein